jgi:hypothetical protein
MPKKLIYTKEQESSYKDISADYPLDNFSTFWVLDNGQYKSVNRNFIDGTKTLKTQLYYYKNAKEEY